MRILVVSQWFTPEPTIKGEEFAVALAGHGHEVRVVTGFPNYPGGKLYPGYRMRLVKKEVVSSDVTVYRVPLFPSHDSSAARRLLNYLTFAASAAIASLIVGWKADVVYAYHPPATIAVPAMTLRLLRGIPVVIDIQDLWPDTLSATGMISNGPLLRFVGFMQSLVYRAAKRISVLSPGFKQRLIERGVPAHKLSVTMNWAPTRAASADVEMPFADALAGHFNVLFAGNMGKAQAMDAVVSAASLIADQLPDVQIVFLGDGVEANRLKERVRNEAIGNVVFLPRVSTDIASLVLEEADVLLVHLRDDPLFKITIPSKTQAYMAAGKPVLIGVGGDAEDLILEANAGVSCSPEDPQSIAAAVQDLVSMPAEKRRAMGRNARSFYDENLALDVGVRKFEKLLVEAAGYRHGRKRDTR